MESRLTILACLTAFALGGCAGHSHSLVQDPSDLGITVGTFRHEGPEGASMVVEYRGTRFEARGFTIERNQNLAELRRRYDSGKHYNRIFSGTDTDHYLYSAQPVLRADNGVALQCSAVWRAAASPAGYCIAADGARVNFNYW